MVALPEQQPCVEWAEASLVLQGELHVRKQRRVAVRPRFLEGPTTLSLPQGLGPPAGPCGLGGPVCSAGVHPPPNRMQRAPHLTVNAAGFRHASRGCRGWLSNSLAARPVGPVLCRDAVEILAGAHPNIGLTWARVVRC